MHEKHKFSDISIRIISYCLYHKAKGDNKQMDNKTNQNEPIFIDMDSEEHAILFHTTGEDDEYLEYMNRLYEQDKKVD